MIPTKEEARELQRIPEHYGRFRRWWYTKFPLLDVCPATRWAHHWNAPWGYVKCRKCGETGYVEYGR